MGWLKGKEQVASKESAQQYEANLERARNVKKIRKQQERDERRQGK